MQAPGAVAWSARRGAGGVVGGAASDADDGRGAGLAGVPGELGRGGDGDAQQERALLIGNGLGPVVDSQERHLDAQHHERAAALVIDRAANPPQRCPA